MLISTIDNTNIAHHHKTQASKQRKMISEPFEQPFKKKQMAT